MAGVFLILWSTTTASSIRTLTEESSSCTRSGCGTTSMESALASSTACIRLDVFVGMYRDPSTAHRERSTTDVSYLPIVSSSFGTKLGWLPCTIRNLPSNLHSSYNFMTWSETCTFVSPSTEKRPSVWVSSLCFTLWDLMNQLSTLESLQNYC